MQKYMYFLINGRILQNATKIIIGFYYLPSTAYKNPSPAMNSVLPDVAAGA